MIKYRSQESAFVVIDTVVSLIIRLSRSTLVAPTLTITKRPQLEEIINLVSFDRIYQIFFPQIYIVARIPPPRVHAISCTRGSTLMGNPGDRPAPRF